ncbi:unnamed protein product [Brassica napus]|uniref:(rape) hypothetical protein n=1 Tax=Brassica napus TaxID=3708 RepID=A0A816YX39_BRANA|nr:unnamed protein product [Brassica napus]
MSVHSPCKVLPSSASSLSKVELELTLLEALEIYSPIKLRGKFSSLTKKKSYIFHAIGIHHHFVLYGLMEYLGRNFDRQFWRMRFCSSWIVSTT